MQCTKLKTYMETGRVVFLPPSRIEPNPSQPRTVFSPESLQELAQSIVTHGILQPLSVRKMDTHFQLIAGERRYRAAQLAGLREIPCIVMRMDEEESALTALMENLQRQDLNFIEEAKAYSTLMTQFSLSQEQVAKAVGKSQSAVSNTLRILRHSEAVLSKLLEHDLSHRHARALLKLPTEPQKLAAIAHISRNHLSVSQTESYIATLLKPSPGGAAERSESSNPMPAGGRHTTTHWWHGEAVTDEGQQQNRPSNRSDRDTKPSDFLPHSSSVTFGDSFPPGEAFLSQLHQLLETTPLPITVSQDDTPSHITLTLHIPK